MRCTPLAGVVKSLRHPVCIDFETAWGVPAHRRPGPGEALKPNSLPCRCASCEERSCQHIESDADWRSGEVNGVTEKEDVRPEIRKIVPRVGQLSTLPRLVTLDAGQNAALKLTDGVKLVLIFAVFRTKIWIFARTSPLASSS